MKVNKKAANQHQLKRKNKNLNFVKIIKIIIKQMT